MPYLQRDLQGQAQFRVFERAPQYFLDAAQAIEQRVAMQVHGAGRLAQVAVAAKVCLQCLNQRAIAVRIVMDQRTKRLLVEVGEFTLLVKIEEQPVDAQARKRVDLPIAEQPPADFWQYAPSHLNIGRWGCHFSFVAGARVLAPGARRCCSHSRVPVLPPLLYLQGEAAPSHVEVHSAPSRWAMLAAIHRGTACSIAPWEYP